MSAAWERRASVSGASQGGLAHHGGGLAGKVAGGVELAKKWCTTTPLANRLVTTLEGKPTCDCKETPSREGIAKYLPAMAGGSVAFAGASSLALAGWNAVSDGTCRLSDAEATDAILGWSADQICSTKSVDKAIASLANALRTSRLRGEAAGTGAAGTEAAGTGAADTSGSDAGASGAVDQANEAAWSERVNWLGAGLIVAGVYLAPWILRRQETEADRRVAEESARTRWQVEVL
jgi:hypothetical protein